MLYVLICDGTNKVNGVKLKVCDEIKGENVRLISRQWAQRLIGPLISRALIGGAQPYMVGGPLSHYAIKERWGPQAQKMRFAASHNPTDKTLVRSTGCAASDGKLRRRRHPDDPCTARRCPRAVSALRVAT